MLRCAVAVLVDQYRNYDVQLNDKWVIRGNTAVMRCLIFPTYVTAHVEVTGWTQSTKKIYPGGLLLVTVDSLKTDNCLIVCLHYWQCVTTHPPNLQLKIALIM